MQTSTSEYSQTMKELLEYGRSMILCGADVRFVELTLERVGKAFGAREMNVFVITSVIIITALTSSGEELTQSVRVNSKVSVNFTKLEAYADLASQMYEKPLSLSEFSRKRKAIEATAQAAPLAYLAAILAAGGFAIFFGGHLLDGTIAAAVGCIFCLMQRKLRPYCPNDIVFNFIGCFIAGVIIQLIAKHVPSMMADMITMGVIMLPIPGIPLTNAVRDMLSGDTMAGILRFVESLLVTAGIAGGFIASIALMGA